MGTQKVAAEDDRLTCPPDHPHGETANCYTGHRCRCDECRASRKYHKRLTERLTARGEFVNYRVDAQPARQHIAYLRDCNMGIVRIADVAGLGRKTIESLIYADRARILYRTEQAILAVQPSLHTLAPSALISPRGTRRRIQALTALGYSLSAQAHILGYSKENIRQVLKNDSVMVRTHLQIAELYERLSAHPAPASQPRSRSVNWAKKNGWVPPLAWDDIDADPEPPKPPKFDAQKMSVVGRELRVAELHALRWSDGRIAREVGATARTVMRIRHRLGLQAWTKDQQEAAA